MTRVPLKRLKPPSPRARRVACWLAVLYQAELLALAHEGATLDDPRVHDATRGEREAHAISVEGLHFERDAEARGKIWADAMRALGSEESNLP